MTQYGTWVSYGGAARIWLAAGLLAAACAVAWAGTRLALPRRLTRPGRPAAAGMLAAWGAAIVAFLVGISFYIQHYVTEYQDLARAAPPNRIAPVTFLSALAVFGIILARDSAWPSFRTRLGSAAIGAMAAPMIFELPFDLIVMARTYPPLLPDPAFWRAVFFVPLFLIEITTLALLRLSPIVQVTRATFAAFALMLGVYAIWALSGFSYPATAAPIALNTVSKLLAFATLLTLFIPLRRSRAAASQPGGDLVPAGGLTPVMAGAAPVPGGRPGGAAITGPASGGLAPDGPAPDDPAAAPLPVAPPLAAGPRAGGLAIEVHGLRKSFAEKEAVTGIDLEVAAGSLAGLVGTNGAGKTTTLSMMTGLLRPDSGQVLINGRDAWADPQAAKAAIGVVTAEARLFERLSGAEMLEYAGRLHGLGAAEARSRTVQLLDVLDLAEDARRLVADYSTGMRKKTALGCALIHNPSVLFLDEPLEGVDPVSADVIRRLLTRFAGSGSTVLFSSHVMELVEQVCDHVTIIDHGAIVRTGTTAEVRGGRSLQQAFVELVGSRAGDGEGLSWLGSSSS
ncbi:MAG TPA: ABC transporter ATP-binding protein [Streptosporangiaceae bacterium]